MKTHAFPFLLLGLAAGNLVAQPPPTPNVSAANSTSPAAVHLSAEQLDQLLGPIALYPDALIALILPASTLPSDVVLADRYLNGGDPARIDDQSWDDSVKALARYPDVLKWMDENLRWTKQLGETFLDQPDEVMKSVQRLRAAARAAGTLIDSPQQHVVVESDYVSIVPAQPDVIYVPYYDPEIVYVRRYNYYPGSYLSFSAGYPVGFWLGYNVDWRQRRLWVIHRNERERYWRAQNDWRRPAFPSSPTNNHDSWRHTWTPPALPRPPHPRVQSVRPSHLEVARTMPISRGTSHSSSPSSSSSYQVRRDPTSQPSPIPFTSISTPNPGRQPEIPFARIATPPPNPQTTPQPPAPAISRGNRDHQRNDDRSTHDPSARIATPTPNPQVTPQPSAPGISRDNRDYQRNDDRSMYEHRERSGPAAASAPAPALAPAPAPTVVPNRSSTPSTQSQPAPARAQAPASNRDDDNRRWHSRGTDRTR